MTATLIEKLPGDQALYQIPFEHSIAPGQWLTSGIRQFPVFHHSNQQAQILAPIGAQLPEQFELTGQALSIADDEKKLLLVADDLAIPMLLFLINHLHRNWGVKKLGSRIYQILLGTTTVFPFNPVPSRFIIPDLPTGTIASSQLLEDLSLPARLASTEESPGCYSGLLSELMGELKLDNFLKQDTLVVAMGSADLLAQTKKLFIGANNKQFLINFE